MPEVEEGSILTDEEDIPPFDLPPLLLCLSHIKSSTNTSLQPHHEGFAICNEEVGLIPSSKAQEPRDSLAAGRIPRRSGAAIPHPPDFSASTKCIVLACIAFLIQVLAKSAGLTFWRDNDAFADQLLDDCHRLRVPLLPCSKVRLDNANISSYTEDVTGKWHCFRPSIWESATVDEKEMKRKEERDQHQQQEWRSSGTLFLLHWNNLPQHSDLQDLSEIMSDSVRSLVDCVSYSYYNAEPMPSLQAFLAHISHAAAVLMDPEFQRIATLLLHIRKDYVRALEVLHSQLMRQMGHGSARGTGILSRLLRPAQDQPQSIPAFVNVLTTWSQEHEQSLLSQHETLARMLGFHISQIERELERAGPRLKVLETVFNAATTSTTNQSSQRQQCKKTFDRLQMHMGMWRDVVIVPGEQHQSTLPSSPGTEKQDQSKNTRRKKRLVRTGRVRRAVLAPPAYDHVVDSTLLFVAGGNKVAPSPADSKIASACSLRIDMIIDGLQKVIEDVREKKKAFR